MQTELLDIKKAAKFLGVKESWLRARIFKKELRFVKLNRLVRLRKDDLENYVKNNLKENNRGDF